MAGSKPRILFHWGRWATTAAVRLPSKPSNYTSGSHYVSAVSGSHEKSKHSPRLGRESCVFRDVTGRCWFPECSIASSRTCCSENSRDCR